MGICSKKNKLLFGSGLLLMGLLMAGLFVRPAQAQQTIFKYNKNFNYDIYIGIGSDSTSVIRNIEIVRLEEIGDEMFLVVQVKGFQLNSAEGFIRLSAVQAILPSNYIKALGL